jgi:hypothetical protein
MDIERTMQFIVEQQAQFWASVQKHDEQMGEMKGVNRQTCIGAGGDLVLFSDSHMTTNVLGGENPRSMTLVPLQIVASQPSAGAIQNEILSECQLQSLDAEPGI